MFWMLKAINNSTQICRGKRNDLFQLKLSSQTNYPILKRIEITLFFFHNMKKPLHCSASSAQSLKQRFTDPIWSTAQRLIMSAALRKQYEKVKLRRHKLPQSPERNCWSWQWACWVGRWPLWHCKLHREHSQCSRWTCVHCSQLLIWPQKGQRLPKTVFWSFLLHYKDKKDMY